MKINFNIKELILTFFNSTYFKFGILVGTTFLIELVIFHFLTLKMYIFYANFIASLIGVSLDYFISTSKKIAIFKENTKYKYYIYIIYLIYIFLLISLNSFLITIINNYLEIPILSKI